MARQDMNVAFLSTSRRLPVPFDPADSAFLDDPYPTFAALRALAPVHEHPLLGMPVAVSHAACSEVLRGRSLGRIWADAEPAAQFPAFNLLHRNSLLEREGEPHDRLRNLVAGAFNRGHTARLEPAVRALADRLVAELAVQVRHTGSADLMAGVAHVLPVEVIAELLGLPEEMRPRLRGWSTAIVAMYEPDPGDGRRARAEVASAEFVDALRELTVYRRAHPGDDLISDLVAADLDAERRGGPRLSTDELVGTAALLLMAGHEATVNVIGNGVLALVNHPDQWKRLVADPELDTTAVEELIRYDPPLQLFERTALHDTSVAGHAVPAGTKVAALLGAAAHDPQIFDRPTELDVGRRPNPHLGFGAGVHYCLGAPLARVEVAAVLDALRRRMPQMTLAAPPRRRPDFVMRGVQALRLAA
jgi:cytochrome P450